MPHDEPDPRRSPRLHPRSATHMEAYRDPTGHGPDLAIRVLDISAVGARLTLSELLPPGHLIGIALYGPHLSPIAGTACVVWSRPDEDGTFATGVEFCAAAGEDNVAALARP